MRCLCKLHNGARLRYDAAAQPGEGGSYDPRAFKYLGCGRVHSVQGYRYHGGPELEFYILRSDRPGWAR